MLLAWELLKKTKIHQPRRRLEKKPGRRRRNTFHDSKRFFKMYDLSEVTVRDIRKMKYTIQYQPPYKEGNGLKVTINYVHA